MFPNYISLLSSVNSSPLNYWSKQQSLTGCIRTILDQDLLQKVVELRDKNSNNFEKTSITCPSDTNKILNMKLPHLVIITKDTDIYFLIKLQIIDKNKDRYYLYLYNEKCDKRRNIKTSNAQIIDVSYERDWNRIELNLPKLIRQAFQTNFEAVQRLQFCGNCRLRRIYFIDRHYSEYDISTNLYENFFQYYMSKWGTCMSERFTQTERYKCSISNHAASIPVVHLNMSKTNDFNEKPHNNKLKKIETNFTKFLRTSCRHTIDNFFNVNTKNSCCSKSPKLECQASAGMEKQKILLAAIKFVNDITNTYFSFVKEPNLKPKKGNN